MQLSDHEAEVYIQRQLKQLPPLLSRAIERLRRPNTIWLRMSAAILLIGGGLLWFLPIFGFWMLPLGLLLIAEGFPRMKRLLVRAAIWFEQKWRDQRRPPGKKVD